MARAVDREAPVVGVAAVAPSSWLAVGVLAGDVLAGDGGEAGVLFDVDVREGGPAFAGSA